MSFNASRLGFWFKQINRAYKRRILCFYDPLTFGPEGDADYYSGPDRKPNTDLYPVIQARGNALGFEVDLVSNFSTLLSTDLTVYSHLWDLGYATPYIGNPNNPTSKLLTYIQSGGAMFILGENSAFQPRDNAIGTFVEALGGGANIVEGSIDFNYQRTLTLDSQFRLDNSSSQVTFARPGVFTNYGTGTPMTGPFPLTGELHYPAVMWKVGSLSNCPIGSVISILDLNFIVGVYQDYDFIDNLIVSLNSL
jgi:hypothetical protein